MNEQVLIIILNWNGWRDTLECLESLYQNIGDNYDIVVVDNNSEDDSLQKIRDYISGSIKVRSEYLDNSLTSRTIELFELSKAESESILNLNKLDGNDKKLILIKNDENYGFTEGNNIAIRFAVKNLNFDYILFLNNDTVVKNDFIEKLVYHHRNKEFALSQGKILSYHAENVIDSTGGIADRFGAGMSRGFTEIDHGQYDNFNNTGFFYALGTCLLVPFNFILELNPDEFFDKKIFAVHEDFDLSWKARLLGKNIFYCPEMICYHKGHQSFKKTANLNVNSLLLRNKFRILIKNYSLAYLLVFLPITFFIELMVSFMAAVAHKNMQYLRIFLQALSWNIKNMGDTLQKRNEIQSKRKITDLKLVKSMKTCSIVFFQVKKRIRN